MSKPLNDSPLSIIEQKSALLILTKLLEVEKSETNALLESLPTGKTSFYTALGKLEDANLIKSTQRAERQRRMLELTETGKEIAYKLFEIKGILEKAEKEGKLNRSYK